MSPEDKAFAKVCLQKGMAPREQIEACLRVLQKALAQGRQATLSQVMIGKRVISPQQALQVQQALGGDTAPKGKGKGKSKGGSKSAGKGGKRVLCPSCSEPVAANVRECPVCGTEIPAEARSLDVGLGRSEFECPLCGKTLSRSSTFCNGCGADFCPKCRHANPRGTEQCQKCRHVLIDTEQIARKAQKAKVERSLYYVVLAIGSLGLVIEAIVLFF